MSFQIVSEGSPLPISMLRDMTNSGAFNEIANDTNAVRHHIYYFSMRHKKTGKTQKSILFAIYEAGKHGPQNGYRLCLVHQGFYIASPERKEGDPEDDIDKLEKPIPQGHEEMAILGSAGQLGGEEEEEAE
ncbi:hypothetical protein PGQ11_002546 [Apiospora arundinis]|uniref:Uncharacterized protein n=1 Tax=Apiospora arundinis TaxID=335852 RepID=A0ABR2JKH4_9PEZI